MLFQLFGGRCMFHNFSFPKYSSFYFFPSIPKAEIVFIFLSFLSSSLFLFSPFLPFVQQILIFVSLTSFIHSRGSQTVAYPFIFYSVCFVFLYCDETYQALCFCEQCFWNTATPIWLHSVHGCICVIMAELSRVVTTGNIWPAKHKISTIY